MRTAALTLPLFAAPALYAADLALSTELAPAPAPGSVAVVPFAIPLSTLSLNSGAAMVMDQASGETLYGKNITSVVPIASITKLMTAMVVLDAHLDPNEEIAVTDDDVDYLRNSSSRLRVGAVATREDMLHMALMASENRAASALGRAYPGGREAFVAAMNRKAQALGLSGTHYADSTGLSSTNVSTANDLADLVRTAHRYDKIREFTTMSNYTATVSGRPMYFHNTNRLVSSPDWDIGLSKTGFINEAGRCLVMQATLAGRAVVIVLLDSLGSSMRLADAARIRKWLEVATGYINPVRSAHAAEPVSRAVGSRTAAGARAKPARPVAARASATRTSATRTSVRTSVRIKPTQHHHLATASSRTSS